MNNRIATRQLAFLQFSAIAPTILIFLPGQLLNMAGHDAPFAVALTLLLSLLLDAALVWSLVPWSPPRLFREVWGPSGGRLATALYAVLLSVGLVAIWSEFLILMRTPVLPLTPPWAVGILAATVAGILVSTGPTGIARVNDLVIPTGLVVVSLLVVAVSLKIQPWNLLPWRPNTGGITWHAVWLPTTFLGEIPLGAAFLGRTRAEKDTWLRWALLGGAMAAGGSLLAAVVVSLGVLGPQLARHLAYPFFEVVSEIRFGDFLTKNSLWLIAVGSLLLYVKLSIWVFAIADGCRAALGRGPRSWWAWGVIAVTLGVSLVGFTSMATASDLIWVGWSKSAFPVLAALIVAAGLARLRRRHRPAV